MVGQGGKFGTGSSAHVKEGGFSKLVLKQLPNLAKCADADKIWDRVVVLSIKLKYSTLRNNINSVVRTRYGGTFVSTLA
jgi:hypothetical protein